MLKQYEKTIEAARQALSRGSEHLHIHRLLAMAHAQLGDMDGARKHAGELLKESPNLSVKKVGERMPYKFAADLEHFLDGLRKAGLPE
jgi:tetratricopeptide (TPR) repeat protein